MGSYRMRHINQHVPDLLHVAGRTTIRQIRPCGSSRKSIFSRWKVWAMKMHYVMFAVIAMIFICFGALYRGQQDMLINAAKTEATAIIFMEIPPQALSEIKL